MRRRVRPLSSAVLLLPAMSLIVAVGCPRRSRLQVEVAPPPAVDEARLDIARHEAARDAGSEIVPLLRHPDAGVRAAAVRALGRMGHPEALDPIAFRLWDDDAEVRSEAAFALGSSWAWRVEDGPARLLLEDRVEEQLTAALEDERDPAVRSAIARALGNAAGADGWDELEACVLAGGRAERLAALEGMAMLGRRGLADPLDGALLDPLLAWLVIDDPDVQWWSAYVLRRCPLADDAAARERAQRGLALAASMATDDPLRVALATALGAVGHPDASAVLVDLTAGGDAAVEVRIAAGRALTRILRTAGASRSEAEHAPDAELASEADPGPVPASSSLHPLGPHEIVEALARLAGDPHPFVRQIAAEGFSAAPNGIDPGDALLPLAVDADAGVRVAALGSLGLLEHPQLAAAVEATADDPRPSVRAARAAAIVRLSAREQVTASSTDADTSTVTATAPADGTTAPADGTTAPADGTTAPADGTTAPADGTTAPADGTAAPADGTAAPADGTTDSPAAPPPPAPHAVALSATLTDPDPVVRLSALEALHSSAHPDGRAALLAALGGDYFGEAVLAAWLLGPPDDDSTRAALVEAYERWSGYDGWEVRAKIIDAVAGDEELPTSWLEQALVDPELPVRQAAARAIRASGRHVVAAADPVPELADPLHGARDVTGARLVTAHGTVELALYPDVAPATVAAFAALAEQGFYDGLTFHRVIPGFVVQGGDPDATGWGGPGYRLRSEFSPLPYEPGTLGMARDAVDTEGSQWFITHGRVPHLTGHYTAFGRVTAGMDVVHAIRLGDVIERVEIVRAP